ncbi:HAD family phosphatase [Leptolyngbya sp. FACHB-711]|uniref:HAD family hydrolase n=1 Tax=unclassified Leptolyngbya TaxID=2650499 RepID=UPI001686DCAB|nr:HAD family phosphatase [Leptolyngbya sp. FACHB-711]MBD1850495.1 HAD family phosphatase [Cyanobacteria bacterium FACHB-502]MBD2023706.1 HAD family phosphatase [Leptolyngbya sp. FACHB-711]
MLKAVLFDFNGVIINDEPLHDRLLEQVLLEENLRIKPEEYREVCLGRSDRVCLSDLLARRGRVPGDDYLDKLVARKSSLYQLQIQSMEKLPIYPGLNDLLFQIRAARLPLAVVSGAVRAEIEQVLKQADLAQYFSVIVAGDEIKTSKPDPEGYLLAVDCLNQQFSELQLQPQNCLAIEDTFAGIEAAKKAGMQVVGVANSYPFHMMQRCSNWAVDYLNDLEFDRVKEVFAKKQVG